jgi:hypothetical protein
MPFLTGRVSLTLAVAQIVAYARAKGWPAPELEHAFAVPERRWRFDCAWPALKIAVEIHGSTWTQGRHTRGGGFEADREKFNEAQIRGWRVFEVTYRHLAKGMLFAWLDRAMSKEAA